MFARLARFAVTHRALCLAGLTLVWLAVTAGAALLRVDFSVAAFFGSGDPAQEAHEDFVATWGPDDDLVLVIAHAADGDLLSPEGIRRIEEVGTLLEALKGVRKVDSIATAAPVVGANPGLIDLEPLVDALPDDAEVDAWRARVLANPSLSPGLISADGRTSALLVETHVSSDAVADVVPMMAELNAALAALDDPGITWTSAGIPAVRAEFFGTILSDQALFVPLGMLLIVVCLWLVFRRLHGVLVPAAAAFVPVAMVFGLMGWTGEDVGLLNQVYATLLPAIAVADAIHLVSRFHEEARRLAPPGVELTYELRCDAIVEATARIGAACMLTSLTTAVGFGSLVLADMPILRSFGLYAAAGVVLAYGTVLVVVPILLTVTRGPPPPAGPEHGGTVGDRLLDACADLALGRAPLVLAATAVVVAGCLWLGRGVVVDNNLTQLLKPEHPTSAANHLADTELGGILSLDIDLKGPPESLKDPRVYSALLALEDWAHEQPEVRAVVSPATMLALLHEAMLGERGLPDTAAGVAQFFLLAEGNDALLELLQPDYDRARMSIRTRDEGGVVFGAFSDRVQAELDRLWSDDLPAEAVITGTPFVAYRGINHVTQDLRASLTLAFGIIAVVIGLLLRSVRTALLCLLPNALPLLAGLGLLGLTGWQLDPTPAVIFTVALGIAVDDTLHMLARTLEERRAGLELEPAVRRAILHSGRAVGITSIILMGGFGVNMLSSFQATTVLGALGAAVIFAALIADVFVLPALLVTFGLGGKP